MKKVTCTVLYEQRVNGYTLHKIIVKSNYIGTITLLGMHGFDKLNDMYKHTLNILKQNNFYVHKWEEFNATWYGIDFLNIKTLEVNTYSYKEEV
jgi:hypothetical protein